MLSKLENLIENIPDFPKKGVIFKDISPILKENFPELINEMSKMVDWDSIDAVAGIESRGFILGSALAAINGKGFVAIRKKGKLPPPVISESYSLEYGEDQLEMRENQKSLRLLLVDDVLATGGTLKAAMTLCQKANYEIKDMIVLIDLKFLNSLEKDGIKVKSLWNYS